MPKELRNDTYCHNQSEYSTKSSVKDYPEQCVILTTIRKTTMNTVAQLSVKTHGNIPDFTFPPTRIQTLKGQKAELALTTTVAVNSLSLKLKISSTNEHPKQPGMSKFLPSAHETNNFFIPFVAK